MKPAGAQQLTVFPCDLARANDFVRRLHRHHQPTQTHKFSLAVADEGNTVRGVAIVGRPAARLLDDGWTAEVSRVATDGCLNACSALYGASWRTAKAMGYRRMVSYILDSETGASLRGAGWRHVGGAGGGSWSRPSRPREDNHPLERKQRWEVGDLPPYPAPPDFGTTPSPQMALSLEVP